MARARPPEFFPFVALLLLAASCSDTKDAADKSDAATTQPQAPAMAVAPPAPPIPARQISAMAEYESVKRTFITSWIDESRRESIDTEIDLSHCDFAAEDIYGYKPSYVIVKDDYNPNHDPYIVLAVAGVMIESKLRVYDIDQKLWRDDLNLAEKAHLDWLNRQNYFDNPQFNGKPDYEVAHYDQMIEILVKKLNSKNLGATFRYTSACGGSDSTAFILEAEPKASLLAIMTKWNWLLCRNRKVDPFDMKQCLGWVTVATPSEEVAGDMYYIAKWGTEKSTRGSFSFRNRPDGEYKVTVRPQGVAFTRTPDDAWTDVF